jgi:RecA/RadA recombinase
MSFSSVSLRLTASDLLKEYEKQHVVLSSGNSQLDLLLGGGFREGIVTEICGEASAGKTQICLQLLLQACLPKSMGGLYASSCYISTEGIGFMKRLHSLADAFASQYHFLTNITTTAINTSTIEQKRQKTSHHQRGNPNYFLDKIYIEQAYEVEDLLELMV